MVIIPSTTKRGDSILNRFILLICYTLVRVRLVIVTLTCTQDVHKMLITVGFLESHYTFHLISSPLHCTSHHTTHHVTQNIQFFTKYWGGSPASGAHKTLAANPNQKVDWSGVLDQSKSRYGCCRCCCCCC